MSKKTSEKKVLIEIPDWIYYGGGEVFLKYRRPDGEWYESVFYPIDSLEVVDTKQKAKEKMELVDQVFDWIWGGWNLDLGNKDRAKEHFISVLKSELHPKKEEVGEE